MYQSRGQNAGFTMIELIMVIVIVGILAAAALPRFSDLSTRAEVSTNQGMAGALRASVGVAHTAWFAAGSNTSSAATITLDNTGISINTAGYPDGGSNFAGTNLGCSNIWTQLLANAPSVVFSSGTCASTDAVCYKVGYSGSTCTYNMYNNGSAASHTITYDMSNGAVTYT